jgi:hypothetical protein
MLDPAVKVQNVRNVTGFDPVTLLPSRQVQITYTVGDHGPFVHVTPQENFNEAYLHDVTGKTVTTLRNAGVLK